jgi:tetratricopeptide (TPR) repeat protein
VSRHTSREQLTSLIAGEPERSGRAVWADEILDAAMWVRGEDGDLVTKVCSRLSADERLPVHIRAASRMLNAGFSTPLDYHGALSAAQALAAAGDLVWATWALKAVSGLARNSNHRDVGELLTLAVFLTLDRIDHRPGLRYPNAVTEWGADPGARWSDALAAVERLDVPALATQLRACKAWLAASDAASGHDDGSLSEALTIAEQFFNQQQQIRRTTQALRTRSFQRVGSLIPAMGTERFSWYEWYAEQSNISGDDLAALYDRWTTNLIALGDFPMAMETLRRFPGDRTSSAVARLESVEGFMWRAAGDADRALEHNDRALELLGTAPAALAAGNVWLNRAYSLAEKDRNEAYAAAMTALSEYERHPRATLGLWDARSLLCILGPDSDERVRVARLILDAERAGELPDPVRRLSLINAGRVLAPTNADEASEAFQRAADRPQTRLAIMAQLELARLAFANRGLLAKGIDGLLLARNAASQARAQGNRLLSARAGLHLSNWLVENDGSMTEGFRTAEAALADLGSALAGVTTESGTRLVAELRGDLDSLFVAAATTNGLLALRIAEVGRALRLQALMRLQPSALPDQIRTALAALASAERVRDGGTGASIDDETRALRGAAARSYERETTRIESVAGTVFRSLVADPPADVEVCRWRFPRAHLLTLTEMEDGVGWTWWQPDRDSPQAGVARLTDRGWRTLGLWASMQTSDNRDDPLEGLEGLIPDPLRATLSSRGISGSVDLLVIPSGRLWAVPLAALPVDGTGTELVRRTRLTACASLALAATIAVAPTAMQAWAGGYANPSLAGARMERTALQEWRPSLMAWRSLKHAHQALHHDHDQTKLLLAVLATHGEYGPGLAQSARDHRGNILTAGNALLMSFPPVTSLPICFGLDNLNPTGDDEPIGLPTVAQVRGSTWVIGGHQSLMDEPIGLILAQTYRSIRAGINVVDALRSAQIDWLDMMSGGGPNGNAMAAREPRNWALTLIGPPHPDSWAPTLPPGPMP